MLTNHNSEDDAPRAPSSHVPASWHYAYGALVASAHLSAAWQFWVLGGSLVWGGLVVLWVGVFGGCGGWVERRKKEKEKKEKKKWMEEEKEELGWLKERATAFEAMVRARDVPGEEGEELRRLWGAYYSKLAERPGCQPSPAKTRVEAPKPERPQSPKPGPSERRARTVTSLEGEEAVLGLEEEEEEEGAGANSAD